MRHVTQVQFLEDAYAEVTGSQAESFLDLAYAPDLPYESRPCCKIKLTYPEVMKLGSFSQRAGFPHYKS